MSDYNQLSIQEFAEAHAKRLLSRILMDEKMMKELIDDNPNLVFTQIIGLLTEMVKKQNQTNVQINLASVLRQISDKTEEKTIDATPKRLKPIRKPD